MKRWIEQLKELSLSEWWLIVTAMALLPAVAILLRVLGYGRARAVMKRFTPVHAIPMNSPEVDPKSASPPQVIARMIAVAAAHGPYRANCLKQSLVLWWMLARRDTHSEIRFGVPKVQDQTFAAHAWVECDGEALDGSVASNQQLQSLGNR